MPLVPNFSVSNNTPNTNAFVVTDLSTGSDGAIVDRKIFIYKIDNTVFTGNYIDFPLSAGSTITPSILDKDYAFNFLIQWVDSSGNVLYSKSLLVVFSGFLEWFYYSLTEKLSSQPDIANDTDFMQNYFILRNFIDSANQAISVGQSQFNAQAAIARGQYLQTNQNLFF